MTAAEAIRQFPYQDGIDVPRRVAVCPYCQAPLFVQATAWNEMPSGRMVVCDADVTCTAEPDIDSDDWEEWWDSHREMPYVYQLPVDEKVLRWLRNRRVKS